MQDELLLVARICIDREVYEVSIQFNAYDYWIFKMALNELKCLSTYLVDVASVVRLIAMEGVGIPVPEHLVVDCMADLDSFRSRPCLRHLSQAVGKSLVNYLIQVKAQKPAWVFSSSFQPRLIG